MTTDLAPAPVFDKFSDLMWGLCLAFSLTPLLEYIGKEPPPSPWDVFVRSVCALAVFVTVLRNYFVNRKLIIHYAAVYEHCRPEYGGDFDWLLNAYIASFFAVGLFQYRPLGSAISLVIAGATGLLVLRYERRIFAGRGGKAGERKSAWGWASLDDDGGRQAQITALLKLYSFWWAFDLVLLIAGLLLTLAVSRWWSWFEGERGLWVFSTVLWIFNAADMWVNREFHFGRPPRAPAAAPAAPSARIEA